MVELLCLQRSRACGSSSDDDSVLWTEEFDEELESISLMDDDMEVLPLEPMLAPSRAPPLLGKGPFCNVIGLPLPPSRVRLHGRSPWREPFSSSSSSSNVM